MSDAKKIPFSGLLQLSGLIVGFMWYAAICGLGMFVLILIFGDQTESTVSLPVNLPFSIREPNELIPGSAVRYQGEAVKWINLQGEGQINVRLSELAAGPRALLFLQLSITMAALLFGLFQLRRLLHNAQAGEVFIRKNARHLFWLGLVLCLAPVVAWLFECCWRFVFDFSGSQNFSISMAPDINFVTGLLLMVLADAFRIGVQMREDQELTV